MEQRLSVLEARRTETCNTDGPSVPAPTGHAVSLLEARIRVVEDLVKQASPSATEHTLHVRVNELDGVLKALSKRLEYHLEEYKEYKKDKEDKEYKERKEATLQRELSDKTAQRELAASFSAVEEMASTELIGLSQSLYKAIHAMEVRFAQLEQMVSDDPASARCSPKQVPHPGKLDAASRTPSAPPLGRNSSAPPSLAEFLKKRVSELPANPAETLSLPAKPDLQGVGLLSSALSPVSSNMKVAIHALPSNGDTDTAQVLSARSMNSGTTGTGGTGIASDRSSVSGSIDVTGRLRARNEELRSISKRGSTNHYLSQRSEALRSAGESDPNFAVTQPQQWKI